MGEPQQRGPSAPVTARRIRDAAIVGLALVAALAPMPAPVIECFYSTGLYPRVQRLLTPLSNLVPFALFDILVITAVGWVGVSLTAMIREVRRHHALQPLVRWGRRLVVLAALVYLAFVGLWGLNYRRVPIASRLLLRDTAPDVTAVMQLGLEAVRQMNALHDDAHATGWDGAEWKDPELVAAYAAV